MSIPASQVVSINPRLLTSGGTDLEFNGLFLSKSHDIPSTQLVLPFPSPDDVADYFGEDSEEYIAATVYFNGYDNSFKKPRAMYIAAHLNEDHEAFLRGGSFTDLPAETLLELQKVVDGNISMTCGPGTVTAVNLDFSMCTSLSDIAKKIQDAMTPPISPATSGENQGGAVNLPALIGVTDGSFCIDIDGVQQTVVGLNIDAASTVYSIASDLQYKLSGVTVNVVGGTNITITSNTTGVTSSVGDAYPAATGTFVGDNLGLTTAGGNTLTVGVDIVYPTNYVMVSWNTIHNCFEIRSSIAGAGSGITYPTGNLADILKWSEATGAILSPGIEAVSLTETLNNILDITQNWVCFTTLWQVDKNEALELARWSTARGVNYLYVMWDTDENNKLSGATTISDVLIAANIAATTAVYGQLEYAAMILGTAASIDWNRRQGVITFAFKSQAGVAANVVTGLHANNLKARKVNFMGDYATRNDNFIFMYPGCMFGEWAWIDTYLNAIWLVNALQVSIISGLKQSPRVPYNNDGYTQIRAWCMDVINRAYYNGIIDSGVSISESVKAELFREAGVDITNDLDIDGFFLQINDPAPSVRMARESPECSLWYTYGGSIHRIDLASTVVV